VTAPTRGAVLTPARAAAAVDALGEAFAAADTPRVLARFVPDDDVAYVGSEPGEVAVGRAALVGLLAGLFARDERYGWEAALVRVLPYAAGAFVVAEAALTVTPYGRPGDVEVVGYRLTGTLEPVGATWCWRTVQGAEHTT
jgi:hypothetical protein